MKYYTYAHYTPEGVPFYIGKGKGSRAYDFGRNSNWLSVVETFGNFKVEILSHWDTEKEALEHEKFLIQCFKDMGFELSNLCDGGFCNSGWKHGEAFKKMMRDRFSGNKNHFFGRSHSEETKLKISKAKAGIQGPWLGKPRTEETKRKISKSLVGKPGRPHTEDSKIKISKSKLGKKGPPVSEETRIKLSLAAKESWKKRKLSFKGN